MSRISLNRPKSTAPKTRLLVTATFALCLLGTSSLIATSNFEATAQTSESSGSVTKVDITLKGYVLGLKVMRANYGAVYDQDHYIASSQLKTSGLGAFLKKFKIWSQTSGSFDGSNLTPLSHVQQNMDKKHRRVQMIYGDNQVGLHIVPPLGSQGVPAASTKQRFESDDALSALLNIMMQGIRTSDTPCQGKVAVFDSKQHYNIRLERVGTKKIKQRGYSGPTIKCHAYYEAVSGYDPEDLPSAKEAATPMKFYMAKFEQAGLYIPVKITYKVGGFKAVIKARKINISTVAKDALNTPRTKMENLASTQNPYGG